MARERDYAYEALAEATSTDMTVGRGELNAALRDIRIIEMEIAGLDMSYELGDLIHQRAKQYRLNWPEMSLTPTALAKHWTRIEVEAPKPVYAPPTSNDDRCSTCQADYVVLVARRPDGSEEYAPCPDCAMATDATFWRHDGTKFSPMDPGLVRERRATSTSFGRKGNEEIPEWVHIWGWARKFGAKRPFPQQAGEVLDASDVLTEDEFAALREHWVKAGSPRTRTPLPEVATRAASTLDALRG